MTISFFSSIKTTSSSCSGTTMDLTTFSKFPLFTTKLKRVSFRSAKIEILLSHTFVVLKNNTKMKRLYIEIDNLAAHLALGYSVFTVIVKFYANSIRVETLEYRSLEIIITRQSNSFTNDQFSFSNVHVNTSI